MKRTLLIGFIGTSFLLTAFLSSYTNRPAQYPGIYHAYTDSLSKELANLYQLVSSTSLTEKERLVKELNQCRNKLKSCDFWFRYIEPTVYKKLNGPLPVEWETEVFEKYEPPYKREGAGFALAYLYLQTEVTTTDSLLALINAARTGLKTYYSDSVTTALNRHDHFFLCNRLFLLNLATIYTTAFECPDKKQVIPELRNMLDGVAKIYQAYNLDFPQYLLKDEYLALYKAAIDFVNKQPSDFEQFDHFSFIRDYVNPLYRINQECMSQYNVHSQSQVDYTLNDKAKSIFDKTLFWAQSGKGVYSKVSDPALLAELDSIGRLLFYDPILSGNGQRSCASCHKPEKYFTDTSLSTAIQFNHGGNLPRNTPSLVNVVYNHLLHLDGKFLTLQEQAKGVMTNPLEMGGKEDDILSNVLSCPDYKKQFEKFARYTKEKEKVTLNHIISAITVYYSTFSSHYAPFDDAMNNRQALNKNEIAGFNIFMGKAQCGTCHFAPLFSGIKPPYSNNEFEVIGVPSDTFFKKISDDKGRFDIHAAPETDHAFRTPTIRNTAFTKPYMHNGVFNSLDAVIDFYDAGGAIGKGIPLNNQTLSSDSLHLSQEEKKQLLAFINSLNEPGITDAAPTQLPPSKNKAFNKRIVGGEY